MTKETEIGIGSLIFGVGFLWWIIRHPIKRDYLGGNAKGILAALTCIIIGILLLTGHKWKW